MVDFSYAEVVREPFAAFCFPAFFLAFEQVSLSSRSSHRGTRDLGKGTSKSKAAVLWVLVAKLGPGHLFKRLQNWIKSKDSIGWGICSGSLVGLTLFYGVPPSCPAAHPVLPISHQPRENQAEEQQKSKTTQLSYSSRCPSLLKY